jgi:hypothetical protein
VTFPTNRQPTPNPRRPGRAGRSSHLLGPSEVICRLSPEYIQHTCPCSPFQRPIHHPIPAPLRLAAGHIPLCASKTVTDRVHLPLNVRQPSQDRDRPAGGQSMGQNERSYRKSLALLVLLGATVLPAIWFDRISGKMCPNCKRSLTLRCLPSKVPCPFDQTYDYPHLKGRLWVGACRGMCGLCRSRGRGCRRVRCRSVERVLRRGS